MPPTTHASHTPVALLVTGLLCVVVIAVALIFASRALRAQLTLESSGNRRGDRITRTAGSAATASLPAGVARTLAARGLVNGKQLASMSPTERDFFLATVAAKLGDGTKPRLVGTPTPASRWQTLRSAKASTRLPMTTKPAWPSLRRAETQS